MFLHKLKRNSICLLVSIVYIKTSTVDDFPIKLKLKIIQKTYILLLVFVLCIILLGFLCSQVPWSKFRSLILSGTRQIFFSFMLWIITFQNLLEVSRSTYKCRYLEYVWTRKRCIERNCHFGNSSFITV